MKPTCCDCCRRETLRPLSSIPFRPNQYIAMKDLRRRVLIPYDPDNEEHHRLLFSFGKSIFGEHFDSKDNKSPKWTSIGFQGPDPSTDFRSAGFFGLENLVYFASTQATTFRRMSEQAASKDIEHLLPLAITGLNLTYRLSILMSIRRGVHDTLTTTDVRVLTAFLTLLTNDKMAFQEIYVGAFLFLEDLWTSERCRYIDFPQVLNRVLAKTVSVLLENPTTLEEFHKLMGNGDVT